MTDLRDDRAAAARRYYRDLGDSFDRALPGFLDALAAIDAKRQAGAPAPAEPGAKAPDRPSAKFRAWMETQGYPMPGEDGSRYSGDEMAAAFEGGITAAVVAYAGSQSRPSSADDELTAWIDAHPAEFAAWARKRQRIEGGAPAGRILGDAPESVPPLTSMPAVVRESQQAAKPVTRRRTTTTRKAAGS